MKTLEDTDQCLLLLLFSDDEGGARIKIWGGGGFDFSLQFSHFMIKERCQKQKTGLCGKNSQTEGGGLTKTHFLMSTYQVIFGMP